jgi:transporter family protein
MGASNSRHNTPATRSPSAAFGRLRIDSPKSVKRVVQAQHYHNFKLQQQQHQQLIRPASSSGKLSTETTPLVWRKLESSESVLSTTSTMTAPPPTALWIGPALICALCYALYNIFIKKGSASIHPVLGGVILQFVAAILGSCLLTGMIISESNSGKQYSDNDSNSSDSDNVMLPWDWPGVQWAVLAGVAVGSAEILSFIVSGMGVQAMQSIPIIIGGSVLFGTVLGWAVLHEALTAVGWCGVLLIAIGIGLVGIDPGGAGSVH